MIADPGAGWGFLLILGFFGLLALAAYIAAKVPALSRSIERRTESHPNLRNLDSLRPVERPKKPVIVKSVPRKTAPRVRARIMDLERAFAAGVNLLDMERQAAERG